MPHSERFIRAALALRQSHPSALALDVLDLVLTGAGPVQFSAAELHPAGSFGQVVAKAFDRGNSPSEWAAWTAPTADPLLAAAMLTIWRGHVLRAFCARYGVTVTG